MTEKLLFARIHDLTGPADGLNGTVVDIWEADSRKELESRVGKEYIDEFVPAPHADCRGWKYENGLLIDPDAAPLPPRKKIKRT